MATNLKMTVVWDVATYSLIDIDRRFRGSYGLHHQGDSSPQFNTYCPQNDMSFSSEIINYIGIALAMIV
jgi:hypothetical protein